MRSSLNQDVLFDIGKNLIEEGDADAVIRFGLSGREPLKALCKVFASVTTLELHDEDYCIGWGENSCDFDLKKLHTRFLTQFIGGSVTSLRMDCAPQFSAKYYQPILEKIADKKQLTSLFAPSCYDHIKTWTFIQSFSSTLENLEIDSFLMTASFRDSLNLKSLTILNPKDMYLFQHIPKASTIIFKDPDNSPTFDIFCGSYIKFDSMVDFQPSPFLGTVKELVFNDEDGKFAEYFQPENIQIYMGIFANAFPALEHITFKIERRPGLHPFSPFHVHVDAVCPFMSVTQQFYLKRLLFNSELDGETVPGFYCFRKMVQSAGTESILLEIQIPKAD